MPICVVPTADLSTTLGLSSAVLVLYFIYSIKIKGMGGWAHELVTAPFGTSKTRFCHHLGVVNLGRQIIEYVAKDGFARYATVWQYVRW